MRRFLVIGLALIGPVGLLHAQQNQAPTCTLTSPANGATFTAPATVPLAANASDSDGTIAQVEFLNGTTVINTDTTAPYSFSWTGVAAGSYTLAARATDDRGKKTTSASVTITVSAPPANPPPTVSLTSPSNGATFAAPATIALAATASDSNGSVTQVEFFNGTTSLNVDPSAPYAFSWTGVGAGTYSLTARATDNGGASTTSSAVSVTVTAPPPTGPFTFAYDEAGRLVGVADAAGNTATYTYDALGNILSIGRSSSAVSILEFSPNSGPVGTTVTIVGAGFAATPAGNTVTFNNTAATVLTAAPNRLTAIVPSGATTGPIHVTTSSGTATSAASFTVAAPNGPTITSFNPTVGVAGTAVTITGTQFETSAGANKVAFGGYLTAVSSSTTTSIATSVPALATTGHISVTTPNGKATSAAHFFVPPPPAVTADVGWTSSMAIGGTTTVTIATANKIGLIAFDGIAGQRIALNTVFGAGLSGGSCDTLSIRQPNGTYLANPICGGPNSVFIDIQVLPVSGTYLIVLDPGGTDAGSATLTLHDVPADTTATIAANGTPLAVSNTVPGQDMRVSFSGTAGQRISLNVAFATGIYPDTPCEHVAIENPDGSDFVPSTATCSSSWFSDVLTLTSTGTHTIVVDPGGTNVGTATLTLYDLPPDPVSMLQPGAAIPITTTTPGQNMHGTFTFETCNTYQLGYECFECDWDLLCGPGTVTCCENVSAGQRVSLQIDFGAGISPDPPCEHFSVQKPDGSDLVASTAACGSSYFSDVLTLPDDGTYTATLDPGVLNVGTVTMRLYSVPPDPVSTITPGGSPVTLTTTAPGQDMYATFSGTVGQRVSLNVAFGTGMSAACNYVSIQSPGGSYLLPSDTECGTSYFSDVLTLTATGTHTIRVNPGGANVGSATLTLYDVPPDTTNTIVPGGTPVTVTTTTPGQNALASFTGSANQRVALYVSFGTGMSAACNYVSIRNPDGTFLVSPTTQCGTTWWSDVRVLPAAGTYVITVDPGDLNAGSTTLTLYDVPPDVTAPIVPGGAPVAVTTTTPGQNAQVSFTGSANQRVSLNVAFGTGMSAACNYVSVRNPDGTFLIAQTTQCGTSYFSDVRVLPAAGTYVITVDPGERNAGDTTLTLYNVPADPSVSIAANGTPVGVTTTTPGQNALATFSGTVGQRVALNVAFGTGMTASCNGVAILNPDSSTLFNQSTTCSTTYFTEPVPTLAVNGTYTIVINSGGQNFGTTTLTLYTVPADATATITVNGPPAAVNVTTPGQSAVVSFSGIAGPATVRITGNTIGSTNVVLRRPDGSTMTSTTSGSANFNLSQQTLATGTYTILVNPSSTNTGSMNVAVTSP